MAIDKGRASSVQELAKNGRKRYAWRMVEGAPTLLIVSLRFTVPCEPGETELEFEGRMTGLCEAFATAGFPVETMDIEGRHAAGKSPWALFGLHTPAHALEVVEGQ